MKTFTKIVLSAALVLMTGASVMAQVPDPLQDPKYGNSVEERKKNLGNLNWLRDAVAGKDWNTAANYVRVLMNDLPKVSVSIYQNGATVYKNLVARATSVDQKKIYVDSIMLIYDRRAEHFGTTPAQKASILEMKARDYLGLNQMDRENVRKFYKEALDAAGTSASPTLILTYFQQLVNDYKSVEITPEELLASYEQLSPLMEKASAEEKDSFTGLFATSGAAGCDELEQLFSKQLADKPGDVDVLKKAFGMMTSSNCETDFYISVAEQYYAAEPTSDVAIHLAEIFEKKEQFDKALQYLAERLETETDPVAKSNLYARMAYSELRKKNYSGAAKVAREAIALNSNNGSGHMFLAEAYLGGSSACSGLQQQTVFWLAYDELSKAYNAFAGDAVNQEKASSRMATCRANFPATETAFLSGLLDGESFTVSCGWISGTTTVRTNK